MTSRIHRLTARGLGLLTVLGLLATAALATPAHSQAAPVERAYEYRLVNLDDALLPGFLFFDPAAITDDRRVYGTGYRCDDSGCLLSVIVYKDGRETVLHDGRAIVVNTLGVVGGSMVDAVTGAEQAAVFFGTWARTIPRLPGESWSEVIGLTNFGTALVMSVNETTYTPQYYLYDLFHRVTHLAFGPGYLLDLSINDDNLIAGTISRPPSPDRAFRYDPSSGVMSILEPVQADPRSWGQGINRRGDVLGYSWGPGIPERIGVWRDHTFQTYFVEATPKFPTISNKLLWNRNGLIVITNSRNDPNSYLVPEPNVRIKVTDVAGALPTRVLVTGVNARGDLIGSAVNSAGNYGFYFFLERVERR